MSPIREIKENPVAALVIALLIAAISIIGLMNKSALDNIQVNMQENNRQWWAKMDRVTSLMISERDAVRSDLKDMQKMLLCHDRDIAEIRERMKNHVENGRDKK